MNSGLFKRALLLVATCVALWAAAQIMGPTTPATDDNTDGSIAQATNFASKSDNGKHPIWVVESGANRVYLLGSIHVLRDKDYPLPDIFEEIYEDAEHIIMEINLQDLDPSSTYSITRKRAMLPSHQSLRQVLGEANYKRADEQAQQSDIDLGLYRRVEPWFAAITIAQVQMQRLGFKADNGIEHYFSAKAAIDNKPESGLESIEDQLRFMDELPIDSQIQFLLESLVSTSELEADGEKLVAAWKAGDLEQLNQLFAEDLNDNPALRKALLVDRNQKWLPTLINLTKSDDDYLVVVGALHLVGKQGVIEMLRQRGFKVRQL